MKIYGIGGLGVDKRVFSELTLDFELIPLMWVQPELNEPIQDYAIRFAEQIDANEPFVIIGVSFGGMMAIELGKILNAHKLILISSATSKSDIPLLFRIIGRTGILDLLPNFLIKPPSYLANYFFGVNEHEYKAMLKKILKETDTDFLRWAINQISKWDNAEQPTNMVRIHGSADRLLKFPDHEKVNILPNAGR